MKHLSLTLRNRLSTSLGHTLLSKRVDDAYIAAYPRSGSTWLRTILVNILEPGACGNPDVFNARIPAVSIRNASLINHLASPRLIMTHSVWRASLKKAVYLVRDGRDAFISSYHYHVTREGSSVSVEDYYQLYSQQVYGKTWHQSVESWLGHGQEKMGKDIYILKFEDLKSDTFNVITKVCEFLNIQTSDEQILTAIDYASLDNAKKIEKQRQGNLNDNASFYRSGETAQWMKDDYHKVMAQFESASKSALELADYELAFK